MSINIKDLYIPVYLKIKYKLLHGDTYMINAKSIDDFIFEDSINELFKNKTLKFSYESMLMYLITDFLTLIDVEVRIFTNTEKRGWIDGKLYILKID